MPATMTEFNPNQFGTLNTSDLLVRAAELHRIDPSTASLLRCAAFEIDSLRDANLEAHGVTVIDRPHCDDPTETVTIKVAIIEANHDPVYGHTFHLPKFTQRKAAAQASTD